jgi:predicted transposase/invertase (TIGR01784 family)
MPEKGVESGMKPLAEKDTVPVERLNPLNDYLFLKVMGEKGDEEQLLSFLNAVLDRTKDQALLSIEITEARTLTADIIGNKSSVLDVRARAADGTLVDIEVQLRNLGNMDRRSLFYWSWEYSKQLGSGQDYHVLPKVIAINIVNFELLPSKDFHTCFHLWEDRERDLLLTDALEIHFVDMVKFRRLGEKDIRNDALQRWLAYFDLGSPGELVEEVIRMDAGIQKAQERLVHVTNDKESLREYHMREMALSDWTSGVNHARREGRQEGRVEGRKEGLEEGRKEGLEEGWQKGQKEIARRMKARGRPLEEIAGDTGLTEAQIKEL